MKISELIYQLAKARALHGDLEVVIRGYEDGVNSVGGASIEKVLWNYNEEWYYGCHEIMSDSFPNDQLGDDRRGCAEVQVLELLGVNTREKGRD